MLIKWQISTESREYISHFQDSFLLLLLFGFLLSGIFFTLAFKSLQLTMIHFKFMQANFPKKYYNETLQVGMIITEKKQFDSIMTKWFYYIICFFFCFSSRLIIIELTRCGWKCSYNLMSFITEQSNATTGSMKLLSSYK